MDNSTATTGTYNEIISESSNEARSTKMQLSKDDLSYSNKLNVDNNEKSTSSTNSMQNVLTEEEETKLINIVTSQPEYPNINDVDLVFWSRIHLQFVEKRNSSNQWSPEEIINFWKNSRYLTKQEQFNNNKPSTVTQTNVSGSPSKNVLTYNRTSIEVTGAKSENNTGQGETRLKDEKEITVAVDEKIGHNENQDEFDTTMNCFSEEEKNILYQVVMSQPEYPNISSKSELWNKIHIEFYNSISSTRKTTPNELYSCWTSLTRQISQDQKPSSDSIIDESTATRSNTIILQKQYDLKSSDLTTLDEKKSDDDHLTPIEDVTATSPSKVIRCRSFDSYIEVANSSNSVDDAFVFDTSFIPLKRYKAQAKEAKSTLPTELSIVDDTKSSDQKVTTLIYKSNEKNQSHGDNVKLNYPLKDSQDDCSTSSDEDEKNYSALSPDVEWDEDDESEGVEDVSSDEEERPKSATLGQDEN